LGAGISAAAATGADASAASAERLATLFSIVCHLHEHEDAGVVHHGFGMFSETRQQPGARLSIHGITVAESGRGKASASVISCAAKMTRPRPVSITSVRNGMMKFAW
jgi:hypothetical protein